MRSREKLLLLQILCSAKEQFSSCHKLDKQNGRKLHHHLVWRTPQRPREICWLLHSKAFDLLSSRQYLPMQSGTIAFVLRALARAWSSLFRKKMYMLDEMTQRIDSKVIFLKYEYSHSFFFRFFTLWSEYQQQKKKNKLGFSYYTLIIRNTKVSRLKVFDWNFSLSLNPEIGRSMSTHSA